MAYKIRKISDSEYKVHCSLCENEAGHFFVETPAYSKHSKTPKEKVFSYSGIAAAAYLPLTEAKVIGGLLDKNDINTLHLYVKKFKSLEDGLDFFCPECNQIYCRAHYSVREKFDQGFYDYATGACPKGHERSIAD